VQLDGDAYGCLPQTFCAVFGELTLVYPQGWSPNGPLAFSSVWPC